MGLFTSRNSVKSPRFAPETEIWGIPYLAKINLNSGENASLAQTGKIYGRSYESLIMEILGLI